MYNSGGTIKTHLHVIELLNQLELIILHSVQTSILSDPGPPVTDSHGQGGASGALITPSSAIS